MDNQSLLNFAQIILTTLSLLFVIRASREKANNMRMAYILMSICYIITALS